jgi:RecA-family ATPase
LPAAKPKPVAITAAELQQTRFNPIAWIVEGFIPDGLTLLVGKPKHGKSWLVLDIADAVASGSFAMGNIKCIQGDVLYAALEDNQRRLYGRMCKVCPKGQWPARLTLWTTMSRIEDGGIEELRQWIQSARMPRLIILDTFVKIRTPKDKGENVYDADHRAIAPLKALADETGVAIILVHHLRKQSADDDRFDAVSGSTGLTGAVDTVLVLSRSCDGETLYGRGRDIPEIEAAVRFDREMCRWSILGNAEEVHRSKERQDILDALRSTGRPLTSRELSDVTGRSYPATRTLVTRMMKDGELIRAERGKYTLLNSPPVTLGTA